jgi:hypothetical protein
LKGRSAVHQRWAYAARRASFAVDRLIVAKTTVRNFMRSVGRRLGANSPASGRRIAADFIRFWTRVFISKQKFFTLAEIFGRLRLYPQENVQ